jgi:hypothetical protein
MLRCGWRTGKCDRIERAFAKAKQFRRFATRYVKLKDECIGLMRLGFGFSLVKRIARTVNTS